MRARHGVPRFLALSLCLTVPFIGCADGDAPPPPGITPWPASVKFIAAPGENPPPQEIEVKGPRSSWVGVEGDSDASWVHVFPTPYSGVLEVSVDAFRLSEGVHSATIRVLNLSGAPIAAIPLTFTVTPNVYSRTGEVYLLLDRFVPRCLLISFNPDYSVEERLALIDDFGAQLWSWFPDYTFVSIITPLGVSLREAQETLEADPRVSMAMVNMQMSFLHFEQLLTGTGTVQLYRQNHDDYIRRFEREWIVEVRGLFKGNIEGVPAMEVFSITKLRPNTLTKRGTLHIVGPGNSALLLIDGNGAVWELLGPLAEEILTHTGVHGAGILVTGINKGLSEESPSGGRRLQVHSFVLD